MNEILNWLLSTVQSVDPIVRVALAGVGMLFETSILLGLVVPGDTIVLVAATAVHGPIQFVALALSVIAGSLAGESIGFALGKYFGRHIRHSRFGRRIGEQHWMRAETYLARRGGIAVFVSRFLPVLHSLVPLVVGSSPMRYRVFIRWTIPACVIWAFAYVSVGSLTAGGYRRIENQLHSAGLIFVGAVIAALLVIFGVRKLLERSEAKHMRHRPNADDA